MSTNTQQDALSAEAIDGGRDLDLEDSMGVVGTMQELVKEEELAIQDAEQEKQAYMHVLTTMLNLWRPLLETYERELKGMPGQHKALHERENKLRGYVRIYGYDVAVCEAKIDALAHKAG